MCVLLGIGMWLSVEDLNLPLVVVLFAALIGVWLQANPVEPPEAAPACPCGDCPGS
jgi:hypothetical protein